ncbi:homocysteine-responsive endoplasmic reticulum-resident ubiquitin-like domain member 2 protein [Astyanax mexicanus]|uniref:homocysteine-responsive endoplasmic reticulum-resident ubiquitin-like domain member 2 protein n=1 Tax=Astyanax mexicanus TaxID=7994 RepID=UPI0020CB2AE5|nr:homocysteine-responsive endoplasmic reticulum-resident ubiquitin-like domain member 2 protein [Astyanax mexicanus]
MEQGVVDSPVILVIKAPDQKYDDQTINCFLNWTVEKLKRHLSKVYPSKPRSKDQRLVYSGKLLQDHCKLRDVLRKQDEFHMLHLVCASRSPPPSPTTHRRNSNKKQPTNTDNSGSPAPADNTLSASSGETPNRLTQNSGPIHNHPSAQGYAWNQWLAQQGPNASMPHYPMYNPMTLLWWQQLYAWNYHMNYQAWSSSHRPPQQQPTPPSVDPPREGRAPVRDHPQDAPVGEGQNEEDLNRDWLDWVYTASRAVILLSIVYFYSSFSRFIMVTGGMLLLYLHQAGWLPFNLENELQDLADPANHDELNADNPNDPQDMERLADDGEEDDEQRGDITDDDAERGMNMGFLSSAWSFITTFFASLIPEGIPNAVN